MQQLCDNVKITTLHFYFVVVQELKNVLIIISCDTP